MLNNLTTGFISRLRARDQAAWYELWETFGPVLRAQLAKWGRGRIGSETVRDLYSSQVPVADQSEEALSSASRKALAEVMVKVSGHRDVLDNPDVRAALRQARQHVLQYAYARGKSDEVPLEARFEFDSNWVVEVLTAAGEPLWTANRPLVLVWLVMEDSTGRHFVNSDTYPELAAQVKAEFSRRGVPVQLPLFDLADTAALSLDQA